MKDIIVRSFKILSKTFKKKFYLIFIMMMINSLLELGSILIIPSYLAIISNPEKYNELIKNNYIKNNITIVISLIFILYFIIKLLYSYYFEKIKGNFVYDIYLFTSDLIFKKYLNVNYEYYLKLNTSTLIKKITRDTNEYSNNIILPILNIITNVFVLLFILVTLLFINFKITFIIILIFTFTSVLLLTHNKKKLQKFKDSTNKYFTKIIKTVNETFGGFKEVKIFNKEKYFLDKYNEYNLNLKEGQIHLYITNQQIRPTLELVISFLLVIICFITYFLNYNKSEIIYIITLLGISSLKILPSISLVLNQISQIKFYSYVLNTFENLTEQTYAPTNSILTKIPFNDELILKNITFGYENLLFENLSLKIKKGEFVGIIGESGIGKSTLIDIILALIEPKDGNIFIDDLQINDKNKIEYRNLIGYIPQNIFLNENSIAENIAFGIKKNEINMNLLAQVIDLAMLNEFIQNSEFNIDKNIGERGNKISGGQKQRIGIARALYKEPEILIFDESTTGLDKKNEDEILNNLLLLKKKKTIIFITHNPNVVKVCDKIYELKNLKLVEIKNNLQ